jgi:chromosome segregation ATPase
MHRISDFRMGGISRRNFSMFRKLCGDDSLENVVIVTNMWGEVSPAQGAAREHELATDDILFKPVLERGAQMLRHDNTLGSAQAILRHLVDNRPQVLAIQKELVDEGKDITQTAAGVELDRELARLREQHLAELAEIQTEMEAALAAKDVETRRELEDVRADLLRNVQKIEDDRDRISREFAEERARADARVRSIQDALEAEKDARAERQREIEKLTQDMETHRTATAEERAAMERQLSELRNQRRRSGFFSSLGRAIDSIFGM